MPLGLGILGDRIVSIIRRMLEAVGAEYETKGLSFDKKEHKTPEYLAVKPDGNAERTRST